jgi:hypothetical protein
MNEELAALLQTLRSNSTAQSGLADLQSQQQTAMALRDQPLANIDATTGYMSPFEAVATAMKQSKAQQTLASVNPQIRALQNQNAQAQNAAQGYKLKRALQKDIAGQKVAQQNADTQLLNIENQKDVQGLKQKEYTERQALKKAKQALDAKQLTGRTEFFDKETGAGVFVGVNNEGQYVNAQTREPITNLADYTKVKPKEPKSSNKSKDEVDPLALVAKPDLITQILTSKFLGDATGALDIDRLLGEYGYSVNKDDPLYGEKIQALSLKMSDIGIDQVKTNLEGLGVNPTDKDLAVAFDSIPTSIDQPFTWVEWSRSQYLPALEKAFDRAIQEGSATSEAKDSYISQVKEGIQKGAQMWSTGSDEPYMPNQNDALAQELEEVERQIQALEAQQGGGS